MFTRLYIVALGGLLLAVFLTLGLALAHFPLHAQPTPRGQFHVRLAVMPTMATIPTPIEGTALAGSLNLDWVTFFNTDVADHTVLMEDGAGSPVTMYNNYTISAGTSWSVPLGGINTAGFKWSASSATVHGALVGHR